jgi:CheY-like chemotaxis protein
VPVQVLVVDDDRDIADLVRAALEEAGIAVAVLAESGPGRSRPRSPASRPPASCSTPGGGPGYGTSWDVAARLRDRTPPAPVVMFSADIPSTDEAAANTSAHSRAAGFGAVLPKPFEIDELERVVRAAIDS